MITAESDPEFHRVATPSTELFSGRFLRHSHADALVDVVSISAVHHILRHDWRQAQFARALHQLSAFAQLEGASVFRQGANRIRLKPGDVVLADAAVPFDWEFSGPFSVYAARFRSEHDEPCGREALIATAPRVGAIKRATLTLMLGTGGIDLTDVVLRDARKFGIRRDDVAREGALRDDHPTDRGSLARSGTLPREHRSLSAHVVAQPATTVRRRRYFGGRLHP